MTGTSSVVLLSVPLLVAFFLSERSLDLLWTATCDALGKWSRHFVLPPEIVPFRINFVHTDDVDLDNLS